MVPAAAHAVIGAGPFALTGSGAATSTSRAVVSVVIDARSAVATYRVEYGTTTAYGRSTRSRTIESTVGPRTIRVTLRGLRSATLYHYRVKSRDAAGNLQTSGDFTFTTSAPPDTTPPTISDTAPIDVSIAVKVLAVWARIRRISTGR